MGRHQLLWRNSALSSNVKLSKQCAIWIVILFSVTVTSACQQDAATTSVVYTNRLSNSTTHSARSSTEASMSATVSTSSRAANETISTQLALFPTPTATPEPITTLVSRVASHFLRQLQRGDLAAQWAELAPQAQAQWSSAAVRTAFLKAKFTYAPIASFHVSTPQPGAIWTNRENPAEAVHNLYRVPVAVDFTHPLNLRPRGAVDSYQHLALTLEVTSTHQILIVGEGPASLDAPILIPPHPPTIRLHVPILMYHRIAPLPRPNQWTNTYGYRIEYGLTVPPEQFDAEITALAAHHQTAISLTYLADALYYNLPLPPHPIVLTFDDGRQSPWTYAIPLLRRYGFTATFFVCSGFVGQVNETANHLNVQHYLTWPQIQQLSRWGFWIEDHGRKDQSVLWNLPLSLLPARVGASAHLLSAHSGQPVQFLAYTGALWPFPHASQAGPAEYALFKQLASLGYVGAVVDARIPSDTISTDHVWQIPRLRVYPGESLAAFDAVLR